MTDEGRQSEATTPDTASDADLESTTESGNTASDTDLESTTESGNTASGTDLESTTEAGDTDAVIGDGDDPIVSVTNVTKTYQLGGTVTALADVSLSLPSGSYTAVMGPSGSGKSTLLNLIGGLDTADEGTVRVTGDDLGAVSERRRAAKRGTEIGFVFQTFNLMPRLTAVENVSLPLVFDGWDRRDRVERAREVLRQVRLGDRGDHRPNELSGGQRQRVAIARALAPEPSILLADEPTGNVDTDTGREIMRLLADIHDRGNTILLVTHSRRIAEHANQIVHVRDGRIEGVERVENRRRPTEPDAAADGGRVCHERRPSAGGDPNARGDD